MMPKAWERKQNRVLTGGTITFAIDSLAAVFQNNLMQVIDTQRPHHAQLYPDAKTRFKPTRNIHAYAVTYLKGYEKRFERILKDPRNPTLNLMGANALVDLKREQALVATLKAITALLGELVGFYQRNEVSKEIEEAIIRDVLTLPKDRLGDSYL